MSSYTNIFTGGLIQPAFNPYIAITLSATTQLAWSTDYGTNPNAPTVANIMDVTPTANGFGLIMPNATNVSVGIYFSINNPSAHSFTLYANDGVTVISTINATSYNSFYLISNSTANGTWRQVPISTNTAVTSVGLNTSGTSGNLITTGSPIITTGTFNITLGSDLLGLTSLGSSTGLAVRSATSGTWKTTSITGTSNQIQITNGTGVSGNPNISLASNITGISSIVLSGGNLSIGVTTNTIAATNPNGNIILSPTGTGVTASTGGLLVESGNYLFLQDTTLSPGPYTFALRAINLIGSYALNVPSTPPVAGQVMAAITTGQLGWINVPGISGSTTINTIPYFTNTTGTLGDSNVSVATLNATADSLVAAGYVKTAGLNFGVTTPYTISPSVSSQNLVLETFGTGNIVFTTINSAIVDGGSLVINSGNPLVFKNSANTFNVNLEAQTGLAQNITLQLPLSDALQTGAPLVSNAAGVLSFGTALSIGTPNSVTGTINFYNSSNAHSAAFRAGVTSADTLWTLPTADALQNGAPLVSNAAGALSFGTALSIGVPSSVTGTVNFYNNVNSNSAALKAGTTTSNIIWTLPTADAAQSGAPLVSNAAGVLSFATTLGLGTGSATTGILRFYNSTNNNTASLQAGTTSGNVTWTLPTADATKAGSALVSNASGALSFASTLVTAPAASSDSALALGSAFHNTLAYDVMLIVYVQVTSLTTAGTINIGVGPTNTPTQSTITITNTYPQYDIVTVPVILPSGYYALLSVTTITATVVGQQMTPI